MHNYEIQDYFTLLAKLMDIHGENEFKIKAYTNAAYNLDKLTEPLSDMSPSQLFATRGIGEAIGKKIQEIMLHMQWIEDNAEIAILDVKARSRRDVRKVMMTTYADNKKLLDVENEKYSITYFWI